MVYISEQDKVSVTFVKSSHYLPFCYSFKA